jgi:hypothetical protein
MFTPCYDGRFILLGEIHHTEDWYQVVDVIVIWGRGFLLNGRERWKFRGSDWTGG